VTPGSCRPANATATPTRSSGSPHTGGVISKQGDALVVRLGPVCSAPAGPRPGAERSSLLAPAGAVVRSGTLQAQGAEQRAHQGRAGVLVPVSPSASGQATCSVRQRRICSAATTPAPKPRAPWPPRGGGRAPLTGERFARDQPHRAPTPSLVVALDHHLHPILMPGSLLGTAQPAVGSSPSVEGVEIDPRPEFLELLAQGVNTVGTAWTASMISTSRSARRKGA
jgi:hypothetical protein